MTTRPRPEVLAAFAKSDNRDFPCSCLECVESRRPVVVFTEEDIEWNRRIDAGGVNMLGVLFLMMCAFLCGGFFVGTIMACCG